MMALTIDCSGVFRGYLLNPVDSSNNQISSLMHPGTNVGMGYQEDHFVSNVTLTSLHGFKFEKLNILLIKEDGVLNCKINDIHNNIYTVVGVACDQNRVFIILYTFSSDHVFYIMQVGNNFKIAKPIEIGRRVPSRNEYKLQLYVPSQNVCSFASWFQVKRLIRMLTSISNNLNNGDLYTVM